MTVTKKPDHRGEYEVSRKTIACGNAGLAGEPRGDYARVLSIFCTRGCGCIGRPAFPTPSLFLRVIVGKPRAFHAARMWRCACNRHRRHCERSEAIHGAASGELDCFASLAMTKPC